MCDHLVIIGRPYGGLVVLGMVFVFDIGAMLKWVGRKRGCGGGRADVVGDEIAEADYTRLGHLCGV